MKKSSFPDNIPISLPTITLITMVMMASLIALVGYHDCTTGLLECDPAIDFPGVSSVMGLAPWNKLYSIMLTIYSCNKQAEARAHYHRLNGIASSTT